MSDHVTGNLTNDHQKVKGRLVNTDDKHISGNLSPKVRTLNGNLNPSGNRDYNSLVNKPAINNVELIGDKSFPDLGLRNITSGEILDILNM